MDSASNDRAAVIARFWSLVNKSETGCWLWTAARSKSGYGSFAGRRAHRVAHEFALGPIPPGLHVLHTCDVPACVRPDHLWLGTHADNMADKVAKGRQRILFRIPDDVLRERYQHERVEDIARDYGVSHWTVYNRLEARGIPRRGRGKRLNPKRPPRLKRGWSGR
jgi:hypothetical protein